MRIETISANDYDDVLHLNESSVPHVSHITAPQLQWLVEYGQYACLVRDAKGVAGFLIGLRPGTDYESSNYRWFCDRYEDFAYVDRVAVASWARRRGVAESLYHDFAQSQSGAPIMTCEVNIRPPNDVSMKFHQRLGFRQVGVQESGGGKKAVAMLERVL